MTGLQYDEQQIDALVAEGVVNAAGSVDMQLAETGAQEAKQGWVACYVATVVAMMAIQASSLGFSPLIPFMKESWGMSYTQMGTFTGLYGLVALMMSLPAGLLANVMARSRCFRWACCWPRSGCSWWQLAASYFAGSDGPHTCG